MYIMVWPGTFKWYLSSITTVVLYTFRLLLEGGSLCTFGGCSIYNITVQDSTDFFIECRIWNIFAIATVAIFTLYRHYPSFMLFKVYSYVTEYDRFPEMRCWNVQRGHLNISGSWLCPELLLFARVWYLDTVSAHCTKCLKCAHTILMEGWWWTVSGEEQNLNTLQCQDMMGTVTWTQKE